MISDFRYETVRKYLEKKNDTKILEVFDTFADVAIIFMPFVTGSQFLRFWDLLKVKDKLVGIGKEILNFILKQNEPTYIERVEQIKIALGMICFTAYYEALYETLPEKIIKKHENALSNLPKWDLSFPLLSKTDLHREIPFADEVMSLTEAKKYLLDLYTQTTDILLELFGKPDRELETILRQIPKRAVEIYEAQYIDLGAAFPDAGFYMHINELSAINRQNLKNEAMIQNIQDIVMNKGFADFPDLAAILGQLPYIQKQVESRQIVEALQAKYRATIERPIINDRENEKEIVIDAERTKLSFPKIRGAFIPQAYKYLVYDTGKKGQKLDNDGVWENCPVRENIAAFFMKYLASPRAIDYPLIILGLPGSGKSILTKIISGQLICDRYTIIRIPLREVNADLEIASIIEEQIKRDSLYSLPNGYSSFANQFDENPLLIIFDGYDELLQATGKLFSNYLKKIHTFQQDQKVRKTPVRIIVTSRLNLIDKAFIPENAVILKLLEFDTERRRRWIEIWNRTNKEYFSATGCQPFSLPAENENKKIIELAEQPLLLLMLAIYGSEKNGLRELKGNIQRTVLYDNLLRRFIRRERSRYNGFDELSEDLKKEKIEKEMLRLGVVAMGMFNRQKLSIFSHELDSDLKSYNAVRPLETLGDADSLLGSFFFIHESRAQDISNDSPKVDLAFEFLHKTFGEFLAADFILRHIIKVISILIHQKNAPPVASEYARKLNDPNGPTPEWFINLIFTPLFSQPVILEMIREHLPNALDTNKVNPEKFQETMQDLTKAQLALFLKPSEFPEVILKGTGNFPKAPVLSYIATYTMNLVTIASLILDGGFVFNENNYAETGSWDRLASLWRAWFTSDNLAGLPVILKAVRGENRVTIKCYQEFKANDAKGRIETGLSVAAAVSDELYTGLSGLQTARFCEITRMDEDTALEYLEKTDYVIYITFIIQLIRREIFTDSYKGYNFKSINRLINKMVSDDNLFSIDPNIFANVLEIIEIALIKKTVYLETQQKLLVFSDHAESRSKFKGVFFNKFIITIKNIENIIFTMIMNPFSRFIRYNRTSNIPSNFSDYLDKGRTRDFIPNFDNHIITMEFMKTDPNTASHFVYWQVCVNKTTEKMLNTYCDCFVKLVNSIGIEYIGTTLLLNTIGIAKKTKKIEIELSRFISDKIRDFLYKQELGAESFSYLVVNAPGFLSEILDLEPAVIDNDAIQAIKSFLGGQAFLLRRGDNTLQLSLILGLIELCRKLSVPPKIVDQTFQHLSEIYSDEHIFSYLQSINITQYETLLWYEKKGNNWKILDLLQRLHPSSL
jgi:hypothetical protein